jgi:adenylate kinase family enzyme
MKEIDWEEAKQSLRHVLWIGGAQCAGKSTLSQRLSDTYGVTRYNGDDNLGSHMEKVTEENAPIYHEYLQKGGFEWLLKQDLKTMTRIFNGSGKEDLRFVVDDLLNMPSNKPIIVDLFNGYPQWVRKIADRDSVFFLVATDSYQKQEWQERKKNWIEMFEENCDDPEASWSRFVMFCQNTNRFVREGCKQFDLPLLVTGGSKIPDESFAAICEHFNIEQFIRQVESGELKTV